MKIAKLFFLILFAIAIAVPVQVAAAGNGNTIIEKNNCRNCHNMEGPAAQTFTEGLNRKAPDLFYAGSKFQEEFLVDYLQKPYRIRPAGTLYVNHIKNIDGVDNIQEPPLCASELSKDDAAAVSKYLMTLKDSNMETGVYKPGASFFKIGAKLLFTKSVACVGCHQMKKRDKIKGGTSGAALYDAGSRLSGDWVLSYIKNPQYWDPKSPMSKWKLSDKQWLLLTNYVMEMKE
jgi:mono/diheme cytochrome c family protein